MKRKPMLRASAEPAKRAAEKLISIKPLDPRDTERAQVDMLMFGSFVQCVAHGRLHPIEVHRDGSTFTVDCDDCAKEANK